MPWDPDRYNLFKNEREAPFGDLLALVDKKPGLQAVDLGCGSGELTERLANALPQSKVVGIDNSPEMLERARGLAREGLSFEMRPIELLSGRWDLVFSHAALQWVENHERLIPWLLDKIKPGGQLVVQVPSNHDHKTHSLITRIALEEPFKSALGGWTRRSPVLLIDRYAQILFEAGAENITVYEKIYPHVLKDADALADWTAGTALVPYFDRLAPDMCDTFMDIYRGRLRAAFPGTPVFYGFKRTLIAATKPQVSR